jgi:hypothetical protein
MPPAGIFENKRRGHSGSSPPDSDLVGGPSSVTVIGVPACTVRSCWMILVKGVLTFFCFINIPAGGSGIAAKAGGPSDA